MRSVLFACILSISGVVNADDTTNNDCQSGMTPDNWTAYFLSNATVDLVSVRGDKIVTRLTSGACSHDFYFDGTEKNMLSMLLAAQASSRPVKAYFRSDGNSPDYVWAGMKATHIILALDI